MIKRYKTKPCEIEAIQYNDLNVKEIKKFVGKYFEVRTVQGIYIKTFEGVVKAIVGDYIIKGLRGEYYSCKPKVFKRRYKVIENERTNK